MEGIDDTGGNVFEVGTQWSDLLYAGDKAIPEETLFLSERAKETVSSESGT
ncbi:MAG: hypothetical protein ACE5K3_03715 [bacterium]